MVTTPHYDLDIDTTLGGNNASDYVIPSQKAIKSYVDNNTGGTVDQTYDGTSTNAQSGVAIAGAGFLKNTATKTTSLTLQGNATTKNHAINIGYNTDAFEYCTVLGSTATTGGNYSTAIGYYARTSGTNSTAVGNNSYANSNAATAIGNGANATAINAVALGSTAMATALRTTAIGYSTEASVEGANALGNTAKATANSAIQLGYGTNNTANTLNIGFYNSTNTHYNWQLLDGTTGLIPDARISSNIARTSDIPSVSGYLQATNGNTAYTNTGTETTMGYTDTNTGEMYGVLAGQTYYGTGVILGAQSSTGGYLASVTTNGLSLTNGVSMTTAVLTVNSSNKLLSNGSEVALISDIPTVDQTFNGSSANAQSGVAIATQIVSLLEALYPVGSVYIGTMATCPIALLGVGTWTLVAQDKVLQGAGTGGNAGGTLSAGLPEIQGSLSSRPVSTTGDGAITSASGAFTHTAKGGTTNVSAISLSSNTAKYDTNVFKASNSNSIYGNSTTVQPPAYLVNIWERTA